MCFLLAPVTHMRGGCRVLVNQAGVGKMLGPSQNVKNMRLVFFATADEKWRDGA